MARRRTPNSKRRTNIKAKSGARPIWQGSINFGLVNISVALYSTEAGGSIDFDLLDRRDFSRVRYRRVNEKTGREVPWNKIVNGYEYKKGEYVALTDDDFLKAYVEAIHLVKTNPEISKKAFAKYRQTKDEKRIEDAYQTLRETVKPKPYPSIEGFKTIIASRGLVLSGQTAVLRGGRPGLKDMVFGD